MSKIITFDDADYALVEKSFREKNVSSPCPRCQNEGFSIKQGYFTFPIQIDKLKVGPSKEHYVSLLTICNNCGFLSFHLLTSLGLKVEDGVLQYVQ